MPRYFSKRFMDGLKVIGPLCQNENLSPLFIGLHDLRNDVGCTFVILC